MGAPSKPVELKVLEGNRGHRPLDLSSVFRPEVGEPDMPKFMSAEAEKVWKRLVPELIRYSLLSKIHGPLLEMVCRSAAALQLFERALYCKQRELKKEGRLESDAYFDFTPNRMKVQSAEYIGICRERDFLNKTLGQLGLRPDAAADVTRAVSAQLQLFEGTGPSATPEQKPTGFAGFE
jgi:phage terminase small subunit